jgi:hypothetical protein
VANLHAFVDVEVLHVVEDERQHGVKHKEMKTGALDSLPRRTSAR